MRSIHNPIASMGNLTWLMWLNVLIALSVISFDSYLFFASHE